MAQTVVVAGATYPDVPSVELPTSGGGTAVFADTSDATATAADIASGKTAYADGVKLTGTGSAGGDGMYYGVCGTAAATAAKVVTISGITALTEGLSIRVKFTNGQTYNGAPTLNVNSLGAKNIERYGTTNAARYEWIAGEVIDFVYDGTYWLMVDGGLATTTYYGVTKLSSSTSSTSTSLAATPSAIKAAYDLANTKATITQLWENSTPTSAFAAQTVSISGLSDYDLVMIEVAYSTALTEIRASTTVGYAAGVQAMPAVMTKIGSEIAAACRMCTLAADSITISTGTRATGSSVNDVANYAIPVRVVGIKF